jgi:hypothetical protein
MRDQAYKDSLEKALAANIGSIYYEMAVGSLHPANNKNALLQKAEKYLSMSLTAALKTHRVEDLQLREDQLTANRKTLVIQARQKYYLIGVVGLLTRHRRIVILAESNA